jgi:4-oxalocrotonate tautomerase
MPWIRVDLPTGRSEEQKAQAAVAITKAMMEHCNCKPETVSIVFNDVSDDSWAAGGVLLSRQNK